MEKLVMLFTSGVVFLGGIFFFVILGTLIGGVSGWVVGLVFSDAILGIAAKMGINDITMFQFGLFLGFVGGFLKTKVTVND